MPLSATQAIQRLSAMRLGDPLSMTTRENERALPRQSLMPQVASSSIGSAVLTSRSSSKCGNPLFKLAAGSRSASVFRGCRGLILPLGLLP
jgi:hypothetical protein